MKGVGGMYLAIFLSGYVNRASYMYPLPPIISTYCQVPTANISAKKNELTNGRLALFFLQAID